MSDSKSSKQQSDDASLNALAFSCHPCRSAETVPFSKVEFAVKGGQIILRYTCGRCHNERIVKILPSNTV